MKKIKWTAKKVVIQSIQIRSRTNDWTKKIEDYAVIGIHLQDSFDSQRFRPGVKPVQKKLTLMCFLEDIWKRLVEGKKFSFRGFVSFGYGNTFLVVEDAFSSLGINVLEDAWSEKQEEKESQEE